MASSFGRGFDPLQLHRQVISCKFAAYYFLGVREGEGKREKYLHNLRRRWGQPGEFIELTFGCFEGATDGSVSAKPCLHELCRGVTAEWELSFLVWQFPRCYICLLLEHRIIAHELCFFAERRDTVTLPMGTHPSATAGRSATASCRPISPSLADDQFMIFFSK